VTTGIGIPSTAALREGYLELFLSGGTIRIHGRVDHVAHASLGSVHLTPAQLSMLLEGIDWRRPVRTSEPLHVA
jgi:hypothetical protein